MTYVPYEPWFDERRSSTPSITVHPQKKNPRPVGFAPWPKTKTKKKRKR